MSILLALQGGGPVTHATTGALTGQGSTVAGVAARTRVHATSGALVGQGSTLAGTAVRTRQHATSGVLTGPASAVVGTAAHIAKHATSGVLAGSGSALAGASNVVRIHATAGDLVGPGAVVTGSAHGPAAITGPFGDAGPTYPRPRMPVLHSCEGVLVARGAKIHGIAKVTRTGPNTLALLLMAA